MQLAYDNIRIVPFSSFFLTKKKRKKKDTFHAFKLGVYIKDYQFSYININTKFINRFSDIRLQLNEQLRCLDVRMEAQVALVAELQDFFRRRAELELDYSKSLEKMARGIQLRHKEQKQK